MLEFSFTLKDRQDRARQCTFTFTFTFTHTARPLSRETAKEARWQFVWPFILSLDNPLFCLCESLSACRGTMPAPPRSLLVVEITHMHSYVLVHTDVCLALHAFSLTDLVFLWRAHLCAWRCVAPTVFPFHPSTGISPISVLRPRQRRQAELDSTLNRARDVYVTKAPGSIQQPTRTV